LTGATEPRAKDEGRTMSRLQGLAVVAALVWPLVTALPARAATPPPSSIAAIGDSITQAYDACCWYGNHPQNSWSTGSAWWDGINSHYERILDLTSSISGHRYNDAVSGARMVDAPAQASQAVSQGVKYVTILMGANDVCTSSPSTMTSVDSYRDRFRATLATLEDLPASAHIFVSSIPNVYRLWQLFHDDSIARLVWSTAKICQSMLSSARTDADRQLVLAREEAYNHVLAQECGNHPNCKFDGYAVFDYPFTRSQVSKLDYFHPSLSGQAELAALTWGLSWWPSA
jgi:lysophospholipase L1-like esterase